MNTAISGPALELRLFLKDRAVEISTLELVGRHNPFDNVGRVGMVLISVGRGVKRGGAASGSGKTVEANSA